MSQQHNVFERLLQLREQFSIIDCIEQGYASDLGDKFFGIAAALPDCQHFHVTILTTPIFQKKIAILSRKQLTQEQTDEWLEAWEN